MKILSHICGALITAIFVFAGVMALAQHARADNVDQLEALPDTDYCRVTTDMFYGGATSQIGGHARAIKEATPYILELAKHGQPLPKDAMYAPDWNKLTDREQKYMADLTFLGYDEAAKIPGLTEEQAVKMTQAYFEHCMYERTKAKHSSFIKVSYDEKAGKVRMDKLRTCAAHSRVAVTIFGLAQGGMSPNDFWKAYPLSQDWTQEQRDEALWITDTAYAWTGTPKELEDKVYFACKAALHLPPLEDDSPYTDK